MTYKKITEKRLKVVLTKNTVNENKNLLLKIAKTNNWIKYKTLSNICIFYNKVDNSSTHIKIFLLNDDKIYFTVLTERFRVNYPTFTGNFEVKRILKKMISFT